jgi:hypothetical protein
LFDRELIKSLVFIERADHAIPIEDNADIFVAVVANHVREDRPDVCVEGDFFRQSIAGGIRSISGRNVGGDFTRRSSCNSGLKRVFSILNFAENALILSKELSACVFPGSLVKSATKKYPAGFADGVWKTVWEIRSRR